MPKTDLLIKYFLVTLLFGFFIFADFRSLRKKLKALLKNIYNFIITLKK